MAERRLIQLNNRAY